MKGKKGVAIMWIFFFVALVALSASYFYFLKYEFSPEKRTIGSLQLELNDLFNDGNVFTLNLEKAGRISANKAVKDLFYEGGALAECKMIDGYKVLFESEECYVTKDSLTEDFGKKFIENFDGYLERLGGQIDEYDYSYRIENKRLLGSTEKKINFARGSMSYSIEPDFSVKLDYNPLDFITLLKKIASKDECLKKAEYNELVHDESKIAEECSFDGDYEWKIRKNDDYLFFSIKSKSDIMFAGKIEFRFAINLNTLKLIKENLEGISLNVVNL